MVPAVPRPPIHARRKTRRARLGQRPPSRPPSISPRAHCPRRTRHPSCVRQSSSIASARHGNVWRVLVTTRQAFLHRRPALCVPSGGKIASLLPSPQREPQIPRRRKYGDVGPCDMGIGHYPGSSLLKRGKYTRKWSHAPKVYSNTNIQHPFSKSFWRAFGVTFRPWPLARIWPTARRLRSPPAADGVTKVLSISAILEEQRWRPVVAAAEIFRLKGVWRESKCFFSTLKRHQGPPETF